MTVVPMMPMAVPADAAQAVMGPDQPAARLVVIGIGVVRIIRVVAAADKEVAMMVVREAAMKAAAVKDVDAAAMETAAVKASAMETAATGMKAASVEAATMETAEAAAVETAAPTEATAPAARRHTVGCKHSRRRSRQQSDRDVTEHD